MSQIILFHHAQGLTAGMVDFAELLRDAGHTVHLPDLYDGLTFATLDEGIAHAKEMGFDHIAERGIAAATALDPDLVYAGFSLGVIPAQQLAQTRVGARGALFFSACLPAEEFGDGWPSGVRVQVHGSQSDPEFADSGDEDAARALVAEAQDGELFLYPGSGHLFADSSLPEYDQSSTELLLSRVVNFLDR
ncbi:dienelactone hydrolase [Glaciihabitans sp. INWT7]|uniref:dienelactone hydrolase family protein n=1 Tax=Glaciihabitans sp. INWT7 TaxID=2596912 RepID=UPI001629B0CB|nr:dienelactone hydrolase family protein [Glaciihabitans sp. INWT7]QNE45880.1 dienelactone hydrolase [Glaciihabitans sp. INWT7]